jgi:hypothetical protein
MKWRDGVYCLCPWCSSPRTSGDFIPEYKVKIYNDDVTTYDKVVKARKHKYKCGCSIIEAENQNHLRSAEIQYLTPTALCPAALVTMGKALSMVATKFDLSTITDADTCESIAETLGNLTAKTIYHNIRNYSVLYDNYRLPPIPMMDYHCKLLAEELAKK